MVKKQIQGREYVFFISLGGRLTFLEKSCWPSILAASHNLYHLFIYFHDWEAHMSSMQGMRWSLISLIGKQENISLSTFFIIFFPTSDEFTPWHEKPLSEQQKREEEMYRTWLELVLSVYHDCEVAWKHSNGTRAEGSRNPRPLRKYPLR